MRKSLGLSLVGAALAAPVLPAHAEDEVPQKEVPTCTEFVNYNNGIVSLKEESAAGEFFKACGSNLWHCDAVLDAVKGEPNPVFASTLPALHFFHGRGPRAFCVQQAAGLKNSFETAVAFGVPEHQKMLLHTIDTDEKLGELVCQQKQEVYRALWYLGEKEAVDTMLAGYNNLLCTPNHLNETLPRLVTWELTDEQHAAVEKTCVDGIFGEKLRNHKDALKGCHIYFGLAGKAGDDAREYLRMHVKNSAYAFRALAALDAKAYKAELKEKLDSAAGEEWARNAKGQSLKKKMKAWRGTDDSVVTAGVALMGIGDANGTAAVKFWLSMNGNRLASPDGFERVFLAAAPFMGEAVQAKLRPQLEKAFDVAAKAGKTDEFHRLVAVRAAVGLTQIGSAKGLPLILEVIAGDNDELREAAFIGLGGQPNLLGSYRTGVGGAAFGGKTGLKKADGDKIIAAVLKKAKFLKKDKREQALRIVLDIRSRMKIAGLG